MQLQAFMHHFPLIILNVVPIRKKLLLTKSLFLPTISDLCGLTMWGLHYPYKLRFPKETSCKEAYLNPSKTANNIPNHTCCVWLKRSDIKKSKHYIIQVRDTCSKGEWEKSVFMFITEINKKKWSSIFI